MSNTPTVQTANPTLELPPGYELGNFTIERKLGRGGFGITYLARETASDRPVVIKENFVQECSTRHAISMAVGPYGEEGRELYEWALTCFLDEAKVLTHLSHSGIVPVLTVFKALGTAYYVMPQVEGTELHKAAPTPHQINEDWLLPVLEKLLKALDYLHGQGLLHRDIKPSNILLRPDGSPLLIGFGTARVKDVTHTLTRIGTPGYSPSEQFSIHGKYGPWTDLYSLGATCYHLITGEVPQDAVSRLEEDELRPLAGRPELKSRFSHDFLTAIDKAMSVTRRDRWQSAREWVDNLSAAQRAREEDERRKNEQARQEAERKALEADLQRTKSKDEGIFERCDAAIFIAIWIVICYAAIGAVIGGLYGAIIGAIGGAIVRAIGGSIDKQMEGVGALAIIGAICGGIKYGDEGAIYGAIFGPLGFAIIEAISEAINEQIGGVIGKAIIGAINGASVGAILGAIGGKHFEGSSENAITGAIIGAIGGAIIGVFKQ
ncbi:MAG: serine/threonine-protein kinase [Akkermansia sp.]|nr:serine/threonine-protein kinase [Akkermansia sp.]